MGGSIFVPETDNQDANERRARALASASAFGIFAVGVSTRAAQPTSVSGPMTTPNGALVVADYEPARSKSASHPGRERLITLRPSQDVVLVTGRIIEFLSIELARFAVSVLNIASSEDLLKHLRQESAQACALKLDSANLEGWLLQSPLVSGAAVHHCNRIFMWLCTGDGPSIPAVTTTDYGKHVRSLMNMLD